MKTVSNFTHTEDSDGVSSFVLDANELKVVIAPKRELPVVGAQITYHVGSRHELPGHTGATHILEHLMFKGAKRFDPKKGNGIWHLLEKKGAQLNATTWCDRTNYYSVAPTALLPDALSIEADRMRDVLLRPEDLASEMTVVRNEYESGENDPYQRLAKHAWYQAFSLHPYRIPTIGTKEDIEGVTVEKLRKFYDTFYWPNNATVTLVGDIAIEEGLRLVLNAFGDVPKADIKTPDYLAEPVQEGERRFTLKRRGTVNSVLLCFKAPLGLAKDTYAVSALASVLGDGKSSSLYKALVDQGLAVDVHVEYARFKDPSLCEIYVALSDGVAHEKVEKKIWETIHQLHEKGPLQSELARAQTYAAAEDAYRMSSVSGTLSAINEAIARGDWKDALRFQELLKSVTKEEAKNAARAYFARDNVTVGYLYAT